MTRFTAIDCFSGAGGLTLGLQRAGFQVRAAFDLNERAVESYRSNIGAHIVRGDVKTLSGEDLMRLGDIKGVVDLVAGGPPCQGFSNQRRGSNCDPRNELIFEFLRIVSEVRPKIFLMENVSSIGTRGKNSLNDFATRARSAGYDILSSTLNAADFGVAQHRRRMFVVGLRQDASLNFAFPAPTHNPDEYVTVREAIADLPPPGSSNEVRNHEKDNISELNRQRISHVPQGGGREHIPRHLQLPCHAAATVEKAGHRNVYGRLHWDRPAGTITTKCNSFTRGKFAHPAEDRNISMREAARLQGFPDNFVFEGGKVDVAHQIGNAVPPPLAEALGRAIVAALEGRAFQLRPLRQTQLALSL